MSVFSPRPEMPAPSTARGIVRAVLLTLPMLLLIAMMMTQGELPKDSLTRAVTAITYALLGAVFFLMVYKKETYKYRAALFTIVAVCFSIAFIANLVEMRGSMAVSRADMLAGETPFCHLVIPMVIIPAAFTRTIIFPGSLLEGFANIASMLILWLGASLALGRGWCSWVCFFGGFDEGFSRLRKKALIKKIAPVWTYLPWAVLLTLALISALTLSPFYCEWLCPFKAVTEFEQITSFKILLQTIIFASLFILLVVILPLLTRRRTQCGLFCPFAAFQSLANKINIFDLRIDTEKCKNCRLCVKDCPTFSLDENSVGRGKTLMSCTKCGKCVDICPQRAVTYHIKGTPVAVGSDTARILFLYPAFIFMSAIGGSMIVSALTRIFKLIATGSMIG
ncbi:MAG: putative electron transport protein YccM [Pelotomaculum sp. PtaU1.Bin035]|nr:MAG: putative electron transport protein YccM [Pelotomaculum sp. PtaU1.Bin035]